MSYGDLRLISHKQKPSFYSSPSLIFASILAIALHNIIHIWEITEQNNSVFKSDSSIEILLGYQKQNRKKNHCDCRFSKESLYGE